jgi:hypothetical protein
MKIYKECLSTLLVVCNITLMATILDLRFGMLFEELDSIAGIVAYRHALSTEEQREQAKKIISMKHHNGEGFTPALSKKLPLTIVTAACNHIELFGKLGVQDDLILEGSVVWVGRSSMV